jgi:hypothetical protein
MVSQGVSRGWLLFSLRTFGLYLQWEICSHLNHCSSIWNTLFSELFFVFFHTFHCLDFGMDFFEFIPFGVRRTSWIQSIMSLVRLRAFSIIVPSNIFLFYQLFLLSFWNLDDMTLMLEFLVFHIVFRNSAHLKIFYLSAENIA